MSTCHVNLQIVLLMKRENQERIPAGLWVSQLRRYEGCAPENIEARPGQGSTTSATRLAEVSRTERRAWRWRGFLRASTRISRANLTDHERRGFVRLARVLRRWPERHAFAKPIQATNSLIVPSLSLFEVFKRVMTQRGEDVALEAVTLMRQGRVVPLDDVLALDAARLSVEHRLPMADSIILGHRIRPRCNALDAGR